MKLSFHGGAREVGKSCIELLTQGKRFILDAGLKFKEHGFEAPFDVFNVAQLDGLFLTHAHLDHTGALPLFEHYNMFCPIFATEQTKELTKIMLKDSYKIARIKHLHPAYQKEDLKKVYSSVKITQFNKWYAHNGIEFKFLNAGHIPGSAMILIKSEGRKILYTGDFRLKDSELMYGAGYDLDKNIASGDLQNVDVLICESTYGGKILPDRQAAESAFLDKVSEIVKKGSALIPVFALGRSQEILLALAQRKWPVPVYIDGLSVDITKTVLKLDSAFIKNRSGLSDAFNRKAKAITKEKQRSAIMGSKSIIVTTSGMLQGGPILGYVENMWGNPDNAILMTGYQCKRTNGRMLLDEGFLFLNGWKTAVKCQVRQFEFSGHADDNELKEFIKKINPKNLILNHGDENNSLILKSWAERNTQCRVFLPAVGETLEF